MSSSEPTVSRHGQRLALTGPLHLGTAKQLSEALELASSEPGARLDLDLTQAIELDGAAMALLVHWRSRLQSKGVDCSLIAQSERARALIALYGGDATAPNASSVESTSAAASRAGLAVEALGMRTQALGADLTTLVAFIGSATSALGAVLKRPHTGNLRSLLGLASKAGADALPIVVLINFLVGFVMGFQSARQLQTYGADIFVADIVGLAVTRELAPLMTAIIVCGRSGAGIAAELGTMKVSEELDALRAMGFGPMRYLVFPRVLALLLVVPLLTVVADFFGVLGGMTVARYNLQIGATAYLAETRTAILPWDIAGGLIKAACYALAIALIACQQGFATSGGAAGVGRRTTSTVVIGLFVIVLIDASLTVVFRLSNV